MRAMIDEHISNHREKLYSITKIPFSKMGNNEVPHDAQPTLSSDIPPSTYSLLALSIIPGYFQDMK